MRKIDLIVIHCSATPENKELTPKQLEVAHNKRNISSPMGYHWYVRRDGKKIKGRELARIGAHAKGHNTHSVGICYEGGIIADGDRNNPAHAKDTRTEEQKAGILECIYDILDELMADGQDITRIKIVGHRDLSPDKNQDGEITPDEYMKMCPCFNAIPEYSWITQQ